MKKKIHIVLNILFCSLFAASLYFPAGCANTSAAPSGGSKDSIPPVLLETFPEVNATRVDTSIRRVELVFNEYVKLVDPNKNIILSPPQEKAPAIRTKGKGIVVDFKYRLSLTHLTASTLEPPYRTTTKATSFRPSPWDFLPEKLWTRLCTPEL